MGKLNRNLKNIKAEIIENKQGFNFGIEFELFGIGGKISTEDGGTVGIGIGLIGVEYNAQGGGSVEYFNGLYEMKVEKSGCSYIKDFYAGGIYTHTEIEKIPGCDDNDILDRSDKRFTFTPPLTPHILDDDWLDNFVSPFDNPPQSSGAPFDKIYALILVSTFYYYNEPRFDSQGLIRQRYFWINDGNLSLNSGQVLAKISHSEYEYRDDGIGNVIIDRLTEGEYNWVEPMSSLRASFWFGLRSVINTNIKNFINDVGESFWQYSTHTRKIYSTLQVKTITISRDSNYPRDVYLPPIPKPRKNMNKKCCFSEDDRTLLKLNALALGSLDFPGVVPKTLRTITTESGETIIPPSSQFPVPKDTIPTQYQYSISNLLELKLWQTAVLAELAGSNNTEAL